MSIEIADIRKKDYKKAIQFAIKGMHFEWYLDNKFLLNAYGRYFWYLEINRATQIFAAYVDRVRRSSSCSMQIKRNKAVFFRNSM